MRMTLFVLAASLALPPAAFFAQARGRGATAAPTVSQSIQQFWNGAKKNIQQSAEVMPEANYSFKPVESVRTFGQILAHVAGTNYVFCSAAKGEKSPHVEDEFEKSATTKAAIDKALADSFAYCDAAYQALTDKSTAEPIDLPFGGGKGARSSPLISNAGHLNEHYGNLVTYFRIKGIVPPSSR